MKTKITEIELRKLVVDEIENHLNDRYLPDFSPPIKAEAVQMMLHSLAEKLVDIEAEHNELNCCGDNGHQCLGEVTMIDNKGFTYCTVHGAMRRMHRPCRKLTKSEISTLQSGGVIAYSKKTKKVSR